MLGDRECLCEVSDPVKEGLSNQAHMHAWKMGKE